MLLLFAANRIVLALTSWCGTKQHKAIIYGKVGHNIICICGRIAGMTTKTRSGIIFVGTF